MEPRLLTREQAAQRCGIKPGTFDLWRREGRVPPPVPGTRRYDAVALERALDRLSGIGGADDDFAARRAAAKRRQQGQAV